MLSFMSARRVTKLPSNSGTMGQHTKSATCAGLVLTRRFTFIEGINEAAKNDIFLVARPQRKTPFLKL